MAAWLDQSLNERDSVGQWRDHVLQRCTLACGDHHVRQHSRDQFLAGTIVDRRIRQIYQTKKLRLLGRFIDEPVMRD